MIEGTPNSQPESSSEGEALPESMVELSNMPTFDVWSQQQLKAAEGEAKPGPLPPSEEESSLDPTVDPSEIPPSDEDQIRREVEEAEARRLEEEQLQRQYLEDDQLLAAKEYQRELEEEALENRLDKEFHERESQS